MRGKATLIALCLLALMVPARRAAAVEAVPGNSCTGNPTNSWIWAGAPENGGVLNGMYCNTNWRGVINFQSSGNVGIGTATPGSVLTVNGDISTTSYNRWIGYVGNTDIQYGADMTFRANGNSNILYLKGSNQYVGIGNTAPGSLLDIGKAGTTLGTLRLEGSTSGYVQIQPAAAAGSWTATLPATAGTSGYVLSTDGTGITSWISNAGTASTALSGLTNAAAGKTLANANFAQVWNWDTLTTGTALKIASTSLTTGYLLNLTKGTSKNRRFPRTRKSDSRFSCSERGRLAWDSLASSI